MANAIFRKRQQILVMEVAIIVFIYSVFLNISSGVTFLAFGNGAPDLFASLTALTAENADSELVIGGLFGK